MFIKTTTFFSCLFFLLFSSLLCAQTKNVITQIVPFLEDKSLGITLSFQEEYTDVPAIHLEDGVVQFTLPRVTFSTKLKNIRVNNGFMKNIRLYQHSDLSTLLEIEFSDPFFNAKGRTHYLTEGKDLKIFVTSQVLTPEEERLFSQVFEVSSDQAPEYLPEKNWTLSLIKMLLAFLFVIILLYITVWLLRRLTPGRIKSRNIDGYEVKTLSTHYLAPKQRIVIVSVNDNIYACGVSPNNISLISHIPEQSMTFFNRLLKTQDMSIGVLKTEFEEYVLERSSKENNSVEPVPPKNFKNELMSRLKDLKNIP